MTVSAFKSAPGGLFQRLFHPHPPPAYTRSEPRSEVCTKASGPYADMPVPVVVRNHVLSPEAMFQRICDTTHPDFTWAWSLKPDCVLPENPLDLNTFDVFDSDRLEALKRLLSPDDMISPLEGCHHGTTIEVRFSSFELREAVMRFGASGVLYAMLDFQQFFWDAFEPAVPDMRVTRSVSGPVVPIVITSYCADRARLRDPMGCIGVDFHLLGIGIVESGSDAGQFVALSGWRFHRNCEVFEAAIRDEFIEMLVENDQE